MDSRFVDAYNRLDVDGFMAAGTATYELKPKDGSLQKFSARWTDFRRLEDGQWVYAM